MCPRRDNSMRFCLGIPVAIAFVFILASCAPAPEEPAAEAPTHTADLAALEAIAEKYEAAFSAGDADALVALHADDAIRMPPNAPPIIGKEAIRASYQTDFNQFTAKITLSLEEVEFAGDWAFVRGASAVTLTPKAGGESIQDEGKYISIREKQPDGSWKIFRTIWNSNNPLPGAGE